jgi:hypothetical protein
MKRLFVKAGQLIGCVIVLFPLLCWSGSRTDSGQTKPVVLTVYMEAGKPIYKLNGKEVEDRRDNSLLRNLTEVVRERGAKIPAFVIVDVRAPLTEFGKLETALDKVDLTSGRRLFVGNFQDGTMNEIHWEDKTLPIPKD